MFVEVEINDLYCLSLGISLLLNISVPLSYLLLTAVHEKKKKHFCVFFIPKTIRCNK